MVVHKVIVMIHRVHSIKFILLYLHTFFRTKKAEMTEKNLLFNECAHAVQVVIFLDFIGIISFIYYFLNSKYATVHLLCMLNVPCWDSSWPEPGSL